MSIHPPRSTPASSRLSPSFPPYLRIASRLFPPPATGAPPASAAVRFLRIGSHLIAIPVATLAVFAATFAVFAAHCQRQFQQTPLNSRIERRTRPMRIEKRQKRQCSPIQSTLPCVTANRRDVRFGNLVVLIDGWACPVALIGPSVWLFRTPYRLFLAVQFAYLATASLSGMSRPFRLALANLCAQWARASPDFY